MTLVAAAFLGAARATAQSCPPDPSPFEPTPQPGDQAAPDRLFRGIDRLIDLAGGTTVYLDSVGTPILSPSLGPSATYYRSVPGLAAGPYRTPQSLSPFDVSGAADATAPVAPDVRGVDFSARGCARLEVTVAALEDDRAPARSLGVAVWLAPDETGLKAMTAPSYLVAPAVAGDLAIVKMAVPEGRMAADGPKRLLQFRVASVDASGNASQAVQWRQISADTRSTDEGGCGCGGGPLPLAAPVLVLAWWTRRRCGR